MTPCITVVVITRSTLTGGYSGPLECIYGATLMGPGIDDCRSEVPGRRITFSMFFPFYLSIAEKSYTDVY
jgi:hypothetical protein